VEDAEAVMGYLWRLSDWASRVWRRVSAWGLKMVSCLLGFCYWKIFFLPELVVGL
jgi:hypothetical protein